MATLVPPAIVILWFTSAGCRFVVNTAHGHHRRQPERSIGLASRFNVDEAQAIQASSHLDLDILDNDLKVVHDARPQLPRKIVVYYRKLGGTHKSGRAADVVPTLSATSHWGVQVGDIFYELRQPDQANRPPQHASDDQKTLESVEGEKISLKISQKRVIVPGSKSIEVGETTLSDAQIKRNARFIFQRLYAHNFNTWIDNCQSFVIFLSESIILDEERDGVREVLQQKSTLYSNVAVSLAVSTGYYLAAGARKDTDDFFTCLKMIAPRQGQERIESWREGLHQRSDKILNKMDQFVMNPEIVHGRKRLRSFVGETLRQNYDTASDTVAKFKGWMST